MSNADSEIIIDNVEKLRFDEIAKFRLIENEDYYKKDVFIEIVDEKKSENGENNAKEVWEKFENLKQIKDTFKRKTEFLKIKKDFYDYVISVPQKYVPEQEYKDTNIVYISNKQVDLCYDNETGWRRTNG
jgi:CRISPR-associated endonuclease/helicase Cas3